MKDACARGDVETPFYLHIVPFDADDLPEDRRRHGYDNLDFKFDDRGHWLNGRGDRCIAEVPLPNYPVAVVRAGQYVVEGEALRNIWEGNCTSSRWMGRENCRATPEVIRRSRLRPPRG